MEEKNQELYKILFVDSFQFARVTRRNSQKRTAYCVLLGSTPAVYALRTDQFSTGHKYNLSQFCSYFQQYETIYSECTDAVRRLTEPSWLPGGGQGIPVVLHGMGPMRSMALDSEETLFLVTKRLAHILLESNALAPRSIS